MHAFYRVAAFSQSLGRIAPATFTKGDSRNDSVTDLLQQKDYGIGTSVRIQQLNWYLPLQARLTTL